MFRNRGYSTESSSSSSSSRSLENMSNSFSFSEFTIPFFKPNPKSQYFSAKLNSFSSLNPFQFNLRWTSPSSFWSTVLPNWTKNSDDKMEFGLRIASRAILKEINNGCKNNLVVSPLSIHIALNMLASGSTGQTLEQLLYFLKSKGISHLNAQSSLFMELASGGNLGGPIISLVNGIWVDKRTPLKPSFKQLVEYVYKANAHSVDFLYKGQQVRNEINAWAKKASKGHIDPFLTNDFGEDTKLVLANALYFKGTWVNTFDTEYTNDEDFHLVNGKTVKVPFMKARETSNSYGSFEGFKLLKMEYKHDQWDNRRYAMHIFLPDKKDGLQELVEKFDSDPNFLVENRKLRQVKLDKLWLPKLKYEYELDASKSMKELGLDLPFDDEKAEIKDMVETSEEVVYVSDAIQKSYIEVNEEGTVAAAVTLFGMTEVTACPSVEPPKINFVADHPFLFMIKEEVSGTVLFVGAALNPLPL